MNWIDWDLAIVTSEMTKCAVIVVEALRAASGEVPELATYTKSAPESGGLSYATSADDVASRLAKQLVEKWLPGYKYYDEEMADRDASPFKGKKGKPDGSQLAKTTIDGNRFVALGDPVDGTNAIKKTAQRLKVLGAQATDGDWVDQYSSTLVLWQDREPFISAIATARAHVFVSDGKTIQFARFDTRSGLELEALKRWRMPVRSMGDENNKFLALLGAIEDLAKEKPKWLNGVSKVCHCQRLGHFATDFIELMCGTVDVFVSAREKIWDYSVALPFLKASGGKLVTNVVEPCQANTPIWIAWQSQAKRIREITNE